MTSKGERQGTVEDLRHIALFARMTESELERFAALGEAVDAEEGAFLMDQGEVGTECFLIIEGEAGVLTSGHHVATIGPGSVVGEMALIGHKPRNAAVVAQSPMRLLAFDIVHFKKLLDEMPVAQKYVYELLEERARQNSAAREE